MKDRGIINLIVLSLLLAAPLAGQTAAPAEIVVGSAAPVLMLPDLAGRQVRVGAIIGKKAAVIEFWATWCPLCAELLPRMHAAKTRFAADVDFYGVNVTVNDPKARVQKFVAAHQLPFTTLYDDKGIAVRAYLAPGTSYVVIIDKSGIVRYLDSGGTQDISAALARILKK